MGLKMKEHTKCGGSGIPAYGFDELHLNSDGGYSLWPEQVKTLTTYVNLSAEFLKMCPLDVVFEIDKTSNMCRAIRCQKEIVECHNRYPKLSEMGRYHEYTHHEFRYLLECVGQVMDILEEARAYGVGGPCEGAYQECKKFLIDVYDLHDFN